jgi:hypothetical protein
MRLVSVKAAVPSRLRFQIARTLHRSWAAF